VLALARYLGLRGRAKESDALFEEAERLAPETPKVLYERAQVYIRTGRNLDEARRLLRRYLNAPLTPGDPPALRGRSPAQEIGAECQGGERCASAGRRCRPTNFAPFSPLSAW